MNRRCDVCGVEFDAKSHNALRCSASCKKEAERKRQQSPECKAVRRTYDENTRAAAQFFQALGMMEAMAGTK